MSANDGFDYLSLQTVTGTGIWRLPMSGERIGAAQLRSLALRLSERDWAVLRALEQHRFLLTGQLQRLFFAKHASPAAGIRATVRALDRLRGLRLITRLERRIGGRDAGSRGFVWCLDGVGERLLQRGDERERSRRRPFEPSVLFLEHTLAVAELRVRLEEAARSDIGFALEWVQTEPAAWRDYLGPHARATLKPDLALVALSDEYADSWLVEVDRGTESIRTVIAKCIQYEAYRRTGREQVASGVFPLVLWVVPDQRRADRITAAIASAQALDPALFRIAPFQQAVALLTGAAPPGYTDPTATPTHITKGGIS